MKYIVIMSDNEKDMKITKEIIASNVFDAINRAAEMIDNPKETELIEAYPTE